MTTLLRSKIINDNKRLYALLSHTWWVTYSITRLINRGPGVQKYFLSERRKFSRKAPNGAIYTRWSLPARPLLDKLFRARYRNAVNGVLNTREHSPEIVQRFAEQLEAMENRREGLVRCRMRENSGVGALRGNDMKAARAVCGRTAERRRETVRAMLLRTSYGRGEMR